MGFFFFQEKINLLPDSLSELRLVNSQIWFEMTWDAFLFALSYARSLHTYYRCEMYRIGKRAFPYELTTSVLLPGTGKIFGVTFREIRRNCVFTTVIGLVPLSGSHPGAGGFFKTSTELPRTERRRNRGAKPKDWRTKTWNGGLHQVCRDHTSPKITYLKFASNTSKNVTTVGSEWYRKLEKQTQPCARMKTTKKQTWNVLKDPRN